MHDLNHRFMLNCIERPRKINLQDTTLSPRGLALVDVLEGPSQAVLDRPPFEKAVLVSVDDLEDNFLQSINKQFSYKLQATVK